MLKTSTKCPANVPTQKLEGRDEFHFELNCQERQFQRPCHAENRANLKNIEQKPLKCLFFFEQVLR